MNLNNIFKFSTLNKSSFISWFLLTCITLHVIIIGVMASVPPVSRDAMIHHLPVPKLYVEHGGIYEIPHIEYSYYPQLIDILYVIPLWFENDIIPKYIHFSFALLTALIIFLFVSKRIGRNWGYFSALFFLTIPVIIKLSVTVYIDLGLIFFTTASLLCLIQWLDDTSNKRWLLISAISCGLALSSKYNGLIVLLILSLFVPFFYIKTTTKPNKSQVKAIAFGALFFIIAITVFSPWMIKNYTWTGNPIYPIYNNFFNQKISTENHKENAPSIYNHKAPRKIGILERRKYLYNETWWKTWSIPIRIFFHGKDDDPEHFDGKLNPLLLLLPLLFIIIPKKDNENIEQSILISFSVLYILFVFFTTSMRIRYIAPAIPALIIISTYGLYHFHFFIINKLKKSRQAIIYSSLMITLITGYGYSQNLIYQQELYKKIDPMSYISGKSSRDEYLEHHVVDFKTINYANKHLDTNSKILAVHIRNRSYYFNQDVIFSTHLLKNIVLNSETLEEILVQFRNNNISHILIRYDLFNSWLDTIDNKNRVNMIVNFFKNNTKQLIAANGYGLHEI